MVAIAKSLSIIILAVFIVSLLAMCKMIEIHVLETVYSPAGSSGNLERKVGYLPVNRCVSGLHCDIQKDSCLADQHYR